MQTNNKPNAGQHRHNTIRQMKTAPEVARVAASEPSRSSQRIGKPINAATSSVYPARRARYAELRHNMSWEKIAWRRKPAVWQAATIVSALATSNSASDEGYPTKATAAKTIVAGAKRSAPDSKVCRRSRNVVGIEREDHWECCGEYIGKRVKAVITGSARCKKLKSGVASC
ncbi:MAG: hypothetical protein P4L92_10325 [Rudaea sp.]|nr:hypothetical protein [Rudaea sp.]